MAYGSDVSVFVEDKAGDGGAANSPAPWWLSPDVDIPAHSGRAAQGSNDVQIRVHAHEEPFIEDKIVAEVYVGAPGFVLSPTTGTKRIDPGNLMFRTAQTPGTEPVAGEPGATLTFPWTPSTVGADVDGPGHRCLIVRAFPVSVTPPSSPFTVPNEQHEAQHNIEIVTTTRGFANPGEEGAGTPEDPRRRDEETGMWWERFITIAAGKRGRRFIVWAFDPKPSDQIADAVRKSLGRKKLAGFSDQPPDRVTLQAEGTKGEEIDPRQLLKDGDFRKRTGLGKGLFGRGKLIGAATLELGPRKPSSLRMGIDHSNLEPRTAVVLHGVQWSEAGEAEGGMTVVALAPVK
jgi:hypothetical protein